MGYIENQVAAIKAAKARGDNTEAAKIVAHYLLESDMSRTEQQGFMDKLGDASRE